MGKLFNAAVRKHFAQGMAKHLPQFGPVKVDPRFSWPGERAYVWRHDASNWLWISLVTNPKGYNDFFVELGWSRLGRYPNLDSRPSVAAMVRVEPSPDAEFMCDIASVAGCRAIWSAPAKLQPGMSLAEQSAAQSAAHLAALSPAEADAITLPLVAEVLAILERHGVPFLERAIANGVPSAA